MEGSRAELLGCPPACQGTWSPKTAPEMGHCGPQGAQPGRPYASPSPGCPCILGNGLGLLVPSCGPCCGLSRP